MNRNTSFFWTTDDDFPETDDDESDHGVGLSLEEEPIPSFSSMGSDIQRAINTQGNNHSQQYPSHLESAPLIPTHMAALFIPPRVVYGSSPDTTGTPTNNQANTMKRSILPPPPPPSQQIPPPPAPAYPGGKVPSSSQLSTVSAATAASCPIRFQVVIWYIGPVDVQLGIVPMQFRITIFWNDMPPSGTPTMVSPKRTRPPSDNRPSLEWIMHGRQHACLEEVSQGKIMEKIDVPPVSVLNAIDLDTLGSPEVSMIRKESRSMRYVYAMLYKLVLPAHSLTTVVLLLCFSHHMNNAMRNQVDLLVQSYIVTK
jgi:hypothetical protein